MTRINLVIADTDEIYLDNLAGFIINKYYSTFKIKTFSSRELFINYLNEKKWYSPDLILLGDDFANDEEIQKMIGADMSSGLIGLGIQNQPEQSSDMIYIEKYQSAETITEEIVDYYANLNPKFNSKVDLEYSCSKVISMYSLSGGVGKSTIAVCLANQLTSLGKKVLYLDLQSLNTTSLYYGDNNKYDMNLSNLIFSIKENRIDIKSLISKIVVIDTKTNVFFIPPPYFSLEIDELLVEDYEDIIHELKVSNIVDYIIVDTETGFNKKNKTIYKQSDYVINVVNNSLVSSFKNQNTKIQELDNPKIFNKNILINIKNNVSNSMNLHDDYEDISESDIFQIPYISNIYEMKESKTAINYNDVIQSVLNEIITNKKLV